VQDKVTLASLKKFLEIGVELIGRKVHGRSRILHGERGHAPMDGCSRSQYSNIRVNGQTFYYLAAMTRFEAHRDQAVAARGGDSPYQRLYQVLEVGSCHGTHSDELSALN
jgi:hypothetical protein